MSLARVRKKRHGAAVAASATAIPDDITRARSDSDVEFPFDAEQKLHIEDRSLKKRTAFTKNISSGDDEAQGVGKASDGKENGKKRKRSSEEEDFSAKKSKSDEKPKKVCF